MKKIYCALCCGLVYKTVVGEQISDDKIETISEEYDSYKEKTLEQKVFVWANDEKCDLTAICGAPESWAHEVNKILAIFEIAEEEDNCPTCDEIEAIRSYLYDACIFLTDNLNPLESGASILRWDRIKLKTKIFVRTFISIFIESIYSKLKVQIIWKTFLAFWCAEFGKSKKMFNKTVEETAYELLVAGILSEKERDDFFANWPNEAEWDLFNACNDLNVDVNKGFVVEVIHKEILKKETYQNRALKILFGELYNLIRRACGFNVKELAQDKDPFFMYYFLFMLKVSYMDTFTMIANEYEIKNITQCLNNIADSLATGLPREKDLKAILKLILENNQIAIEGFGRLLRAFNDKYEAIYDQILSMPKNTKEERESSLKEALRLVNLFFEIQIIYGGFDGYVDAAIEDMPEDVQLADKLNNSAFLPYFFRDKCICCNSDLITRKAFKAHALFIYFSDAYIKNPAVFFERPLEGFKHICDIIDKYFDILTYPNFVHYPQKGKLNLCGYTENEYVFVIMDMFEELIFGEISYSNDIESIPESIVCDLRHELQNLIFTKLGINDCLYLAYTFDIMENFVKDSGVNNLAEAFSKEDSMKRLSKLMPNNEGCSLVMRLHCLTRMASECIQVPEVHIKVVTDSGDWISKMNYEHEDIEMLVVNRRVLDEYIGTYELFYDLGKNVILNAFKNHTNPILDGTVTDGSTVEEVLLQADAGSDAVISAIIETIFGYEFHNPVYNCNITFLDNYKKIMEMDDMLYPAKAIKEYKFAGEVGQLPSWGHNDKYVFRHKEDYISIFHFDDFAGRKA